MMADKELRAAMEQRIYEVVNFIRNAHFSRFVVELSPVEYLRIIDEPGTPYLTCGDYGQNVSVEELARDVWEAVEALPGVDLDAVMDVDEYKRLVIEAGL